MEKTMKEINIEEIETPNLDKLDDRLTLFTIICTGGITFSLFIIFLIGILLPIIEIMEIKNLPLLSFIFLIFGVEIIISEIYMALGLFFHRIFFYRFYEHFLKKNLLAYEEYLEQEQYEEVQ